MKTMPRIYGTPPAGEAAKIQNREQFMAALRAGDQKLVFGMGSEDNTGALGLTGFANVMAGIQTHRFSGYTDYLATGSGKVWCTAKAIDIIANVIISTEMKLVFRDKTKRGKATANPRKELLALLQNPNPHDTISELLYLLVAHLKLTGNAFWMKDRMDGYGRPREVYALNPRFMRIVPDSKIRVSHYIYKVNNAEIRLETDEIIHFRRPHPVDPLWGLGEIEAGESLYNEHINRMLFNERFMANGAMPSAVLAREDIESVGQDDWEKQKAGFQEKYGGVKNSGKVAWLGGKWSLMQLGITAREMQEIEKAGANNRDIFVNHGVPLSVAGYGASNYATAVQEERNMRRFTCLPLINLIVDALNSPRGFIDKFNPELKLDFPLSGLIDVEQIMKECGPLFDRGGLSPNDLRELCGHDRKEDPYMDQYFIGMNMVPIEIAGVTIPSKEEIAATTGKPDEGKPNPDPNAKPDSGKPTDDDANGGDDKNRRAAA